MKFLADESVDRQIVDALRLHGHVVLSVAEFDPGLSDDAVLERANMENALLLTADKDFGELVFRQGRVAPGVILLRFAGLPAEQKASLVTAAAAEHAMELSKSFAVITRVVVRIRRKIP